MDDSQDVIREDMLTEGMPMAHPDRSFPVGQVLGMFAGGLVLGPLLWYLVAFPFVVHYAVAQHAVVPGNHQLFADLVTAATPQTGRTIPQVFFGGWPQFLIALAIQGIAPLVWGWRGGQRGDHWWLSGLVYSLGVQVGLGWNILPTWTMSALLLSHHQHYSLMTLLLELIAALIAGAAYAGNWLAHRQEQRTRRTSVASLHPAYRPAVFSAAIVPFILVVALAANAVLAWQVQVSTAGARLPLDQQLYQARIHTTFPAAIPHWLPPGMRLTGLIVHPEYDFHGYTGNSCYSDTWVWQAYQSPTATLTIRQHGWPHSLAHPAYCESQYMLQGQSNGTLINQCPLLSCTISINGTPAQITLIHRQSANDDLLNGNYAPMRGITFDRAGVRYEIGSSTLTVGQLIAVATSLTT